MKLATLYETLHPSGDDRALQEGFEARVYDPLWFLARQWQMGEHQGENASTPVAATFTLATAKIDPSAATPHRRPDLEPAEADLEAEPDNWWTMGRRIRIGQILKGRVPADAVKYRFQNPAPPYRAFHNEPDGLAAWRDAALLGFDPAAIVLSERPPDPPPSAWDSARLSYHREYSAGDALLTIDDHRGGPLDWFAADAAGGPVLVPAAHPRPVLPAPLQYPGAPASRFWQIEDAEVDIGGYPPDMAHTATMLMVDLIYSHSDDWFLIPTSTEAGRITEIKNLTIRDAFSRHYADSDDAFKAGLTPPKGWSLFQTEGLPAGQLLLWLVAESPLQGEVFEQVQIGIDEAANLVWAVERTLDGRDAAGPAPPPKPRAGTTSSDLTKPREWRYDPGETPLPFWHPYLRAEDRAAYVQNRLADLSQKPVKPLPGPVAAVLQSTEANAPHRLASSVVPGNGVAVERRWSLARDLGGNPLLWVRRQRRPLTSPPGRTLRFDVVTNVT